MATHRSAADGSNHMLPYAPLPASLRTGTRRCPDRLGAANRGIAPASAQDKVQIKFWTHTHPPMVEQNER